MDISLERLAFKLYDSIGKAGILLAFLTEIKDCPCLFSSAHSFDNSNVIRLNIVEYYKHDLTSSGPAATGTKK